MQVLPFGRPPLALYLLQLAGDCNVGQAPVPLAQPAAGDSMRPGNDSSQQPGNTVVNGRVESCAPAPQQTVNPEEVPAGTMPSSLTAAWHKASMRRLAQLVRASTAAQQSADHSGLQHTAPPSPGGGGAGKQAVSVLAAVFDRAAHVRSLGAGRTDAPVIMSALVLSAAFWPHFCFQCMYWSELTLLSGLCYSHIT